MTSAPPPSTTAETFLVDAATQYLNATYHKPPLKYGEELDPALKWKPSIQMTANDHLTVIYEVSETVYPMIFNLRRVDVENMTLPVAVYCVCPEAVYISDQAEVKRLLSHGYGLLTVDDAGNVQKRSGCIPVIQQISRKQFDDEVKGLPQKIRQRLAEAFERYEQNAVSGVTDITEVIEGLVNKAAKEAVARKWIDKKDTKTLANSIQAIANDSHFHNVRPAIGSAQGYISQYRNLSHHFPKNKKLAAKKYKDCRHAFIDGLKQAQNFRTAIRSAGLTGGL